MTLTLVPTLIILFFSFATGFFAVLSYIEKPVWPLMFDAASNTVIDSDARLIHAELKRIIELAPPTMMTVVGSGTICILLQAWLQDFSRNSLVVLTFFVIFQGYILTQLFSRIEAVKQTSSDGSISVVRTGLGELAAIHHIGLATVAGLTLLELMLFAV
ncbi:hypothetical protein [cf. Phormidesmis sp. LEGE 11477]|uniref:hypothetical protein n=1 Tax=cf. Phormidesmis sp. LEGE 11477 TaxID=1828680 RepID=UPI00188283F7|nr:hypothetical protein [cf. Phormidesmis sp. LEGE 11477]MBE9064608.1 hypothetical protein [cf. Phormidesmis sp. LEGE 11477]